MKHFRKSGGFTLVELVVSIAVASLVTMAATTVLMLALRVNRQTSDTASQQNTVRTLLTTMEKAATDGSIKGLVSDLDSWQLIDKEIRYEVGGEVVPFEARVVFGFNSETQTIYTSGKIEVQIDGETGESVYVVTEGIPVLHGVYASNAVIKDGLLSLSVETREGAFESAVFMRTGAITSDTADRVEPGVSQNDKLNHFLSVLTSQYGSKGAIAYTEENPKELHDPTYYSEWYIGGYATAPGWNADTPWCACYVSWALVEADVSGPADHTKWYANVDEFMAYFQTENNWKMSEYYSKIDAPTVDADAPDPGDLVFFDWITDDGVQDPQHVGVVVQVDTDCIVTIEGNSAGRVAMRRYTLDDDRILGYGTLNWQN